MSEDTPQWVVTVTNPSIATRNYTLKVGTNLVGRGAGSDVFVDDAFASHFHAEICWDPVQNSVTLFDLDSRNGTFVNQDRLTAARELSPGDIIRIGECVLTVNLQGRPTASPTIGGQAKTTPLTQDLLVQSLGRHARLLYNVSYKLNTILDFNTALAEVANLMSSSMRADKCMVILAEHFDRLNELGFPTSIAQQAIQQKAAILIPVVTPDTTQAGKSAQLLRVRSALCVPVLAGDEVLALVYAYKTDPLAQPFNQVDSEVAVAISHQAALTLQRMILIKRSAAALQASEHRFRSVVSNSPDIIYSIDVRTRRPTLLNRDGLLEYSKDEFEASDATVFAVNPDDVEPVRRHWDAPLSRPLDDKRVSSIEYRLCRKDGRFEWVQSRETALEYNPNGDPKQVLVQLTLITERKEAQEKLRRSELMLAHAQTLARLGYWEWETARNVVTGSDEFYRLYGAEAQEAGIALDHLESCFHPGDRVRCRRIVKKAVLSGQPFSFNHRIALPDGTIATHQVNGWVQLDHSGRPRLYGTAQDVTEPKQAERVIKRRGDELAMINSVVTAINGSLDLITILASALELIVTLFAVDGAECHLYGQNAKLKFAAHYGLDEQFVVASQNLQEPPGMGLNRLVLATCQPAYLSDLGIASVFVRKDAARAAGYQCALCIPIMGHKLQLGTFTLYNRETRAFGPETLNVLTTVSAQLGVAIERTYLNDIQRQRTAQLTRSSALITALSRVASRLRTTANPDSVMRTLGTELRYLDVICFVFVLDHSTEALVLRYHSINEASLAKIEAQIGQAMHGLRVSRELFPIYNDLAKRRQVLFLPDMVSLMMTLFPHRPRSVIEQIVRLVGMPPSAPLIYLPLAAEEQLIGILAMVGPGLQENDAPAFSAFAGQVAIAIENARLFEEVSVSREQLRQLAKQVVSAQEDERQRVSRELHDEAGQALTALKISLQLIQNDLPAEFGGLRERLNEATSLVDSTLQEIRLLAQALRPASLDALHNINPTLEVFCREFRRRTQLAINYVGAELPALSEEANVCLYRFLQEALTNVAKHGRARRIWVVLQREGDDVRLSVEDDGIGLQPGREMGSVAPLGIGMLGMQERLELLGGRLEVDSQPGEGTRVIAHLPNVLKELDTKEAA